MASPRRISPVSSRSLGGLLPMPSVSLSHVQIAGFLETTYRNQNPGQDYHVIYGEAEDGGYFSVYKSFNDMCRDVAYMLDLDVYAITPGINPDVELVVGMPWVESPWTESPLKQLVTTVVSYAKGVYDPHPFIYTSSPAAANRLKNCLVQMVRGAQ